MRRKNHRLSWEILESRDLKSGVPTDYVLAGTKWLNPAISYSVMPDGTALNGTTSNLNATMIRELGPDWRTNITRALDLWAGAAPLLFSPVVDSGLPSGTPGADQHDPRFGDVRIGGYDFGPAESTILAKTYYPSPGSTLGGDVTVNTGFDWTTADLGSSLVHELGHALGLGHAIDPGDVMFPQYQGTVIQLGEGDMAGIRALYGAVTTPQPIPTSSPPPTAPQPPGPAAPIIPEGPATPAKPLTPAQAKKAARHAAKAKAAAARAARRAASIARLQHVTNRLKG